MATPQQLGPYSIVREIARGGMGVVYEAEDMAGIRVALKVASDVLGPTADLESRFLQEMRIAAALRHPNVVQVLQGASDRGRLYIAMELVRGPTLRERLDHAGRLSPLEAVGIAAQVAEGLAAAHQHCPPIVHRDLKPSNILLRNDGVVKVTDFGIAKAMVLHADATTSPMGTPAYVSPEQLQGELSTPASDVHALGVVLFEMLAGRPPFDPSLPALQLVHGICFAVPGPISQVAAFATPVPELDALLASCLAKSPHLRPSAADAAAALVELWRRWSTAAVPSPSAASVPLLEAGGSTRGPSVPDTIDLVARLERSRSSVSRLVLGGAIASLSIIGAAIGWWLLRAPGTSAADPAAGGSLTVAGAAGSVHGSSPEDCTPGVALADVAPLALVCVPGGQFTMGTPVGVEGRAADEGPQHVAIVAAFALGATEVTQAQWKAVMDDAPFDCGAGCGPEHPAQSVSWTRAIDFANRLSLREGLSPCYPTVSADAVVLPNCDGYRLPTETEWEYAARAGAIEAPRALGTGGSTHPVTVGNANAWGLFDMQGNVWEWVGDWYGPYAELATAAGHGGPATGTTKVIRGGAFKRIRGGPRVGERGRLSPAIPRDSVGFRIARGSTVRVDATGSTFGPTPGPAVGPTSPRTTDACIREAVAWAGSWTLRTVADNSTHANWVGSTARYDVEFTAQGCELRGTAARRQGDEATWSLALVGHVDDSGHASVRYQATSRQTVKGQWELDSDRTGTFASDAGDVSGSATATRPPPSSAWP